MACQHTRQREAPGGRTRHGGARFKLRKGHSAGPQPSRPGKTPLAMPYVVHVRNTPADQRGAWATFAKAARTGARISQSELARRLGVDRTTIFRWESGRARPESAEMIRAFAEVLDIELDEALAAAGLRPGVAPPVEPTRERDEEMELILAAPVDDRMKSLMVDRLLELRERDKRRRMDEFRFIIDPRPRRDTA
jgi:transcriptional regulator with XRE-family HTH domain